MNKPSLRKNLCEWPLKEMDFDLASMIALLRVHEENYRKGLPRPECDICELEVVAMRIHLQHVRDVYRQKLAKLRQELHDELAASGQPYLEAVAECLAARNWAPLFTPQVPEEEGVNHV